MSAIKKEAANVTSDGGSEAVAMKSVDTVAVALGASSEKERIETRLRRHEAMLAIERQERSAPKEGE